MTVTCIDCPSELSHGLAWPPSLSHAADIQEIGGSDVDVDAAVAEATRTTDTQFLDFWPEPALASEHSGEDKVYPMVN